MTLPAFAGIVKIKDVTHSLSHTWKTANGTCLQACGSVSSQGQYRDLPISVRI